MPMGRRHTAARSGLVAGCVVAVGFVGAYASAAPGSTTASVPVIGSETERALFDATVLVPGRTYQRCLSVSATAADPSDAVTFRADAVDGTLASHLNIVVQVGTGGDYADRCAGFQAASAVTVFSGPLTALAAGPVATGWRPAAVARRTFRISVSVDDDSALMGRLARADLSWDLTSSADSTTSDDTSATPADPTPEVPSIGSDPLPPDDHGAGSVGAVPGGGSTVSTPTATAAAGAGKATASAAPTTFPASSSTASAGPALGAGASPTIPVQTPGGSRPGTSTTTSGAVRAPGTSGRTDAAPDITLGSPVAAVKATVTRAGRAIARVATSPQYPLAAIVLAVGFLAVQDQIDRRDPKLALASRRQRDNEVEFPDIFGVPA